MTHGFAKSFKRSYGSGPHCTFSNGSIADYEPYKLSSLRVFTAVKGTILTNPVLTFEQLILTAVFLAVMTPTYVLQSRSAGMVSKDDRRAAFEKLRDQETNMRKFSLIMTFTAAFLVSLYLSVMIGRWWAMRTAGVGAIKGAAADLTLYLSQFVTKDPQVLRAIRGNSRASLRLIFMWRRGLINPGKAPEISVLRSELVDTNMLSEEDIQKLVSERWGQNLWESLWAWNVSIVRMLWEQGRMKENHQLLVFLLEKCSEGRNGVQVIATHVGVKMPMQYVHLLGLIVKLHNIICAVLMGILFSSALKARNLIICAQLFGRTLLMPFLFNAILLICAELSDPFNGGEGDFPADKYDDGLEKDVKSFVDAGECLPNWLQSRQAIGSVRQ